MKLFLSHKNWTLLYKRFQIFILFFLKMVYYRILKEMNQFANITPKLRNHSQRIYNFTFGLLYISLSAYNYVQSEFPLPDIRSVYRHMDGILIIKP